MNEVLYQVYNRGCRDGTEQPYQAIPFRIPGDGGTELPETVGSPALRDARSIETLLDADLTSVNWELVRRRSRLVANVISEREQNCTAAGAEVESFHW